MNGSEYQQQAARTLIEKPDFLVTNRDLEYIGGGLALGGLTGAVCELLKKGILHRHGLSLERYTQALRTVGEKAHWLASRVGWGRRPDDDAPAPDRDVMLVWNVIGILGEAGEIAALMIEAIATGVLDRDKLAKEIGDLLWYAAALCTKVGLDLGAVMALNIEKLKERYPDGWNHERSKAHVAQIETTTPA